MDGYHGIVGEDELLAARQAGDEATVALARRQQTALREVGFLGPGATSLNRIERYLEFMRRAWPIVPDDQVAVEAEMVRLRDRVVVGAAWLGPAAGKLQDGVLRHQPWRLPMRVLAAEGIERPLGVDDLLDPGLSTARRPWRDVGVAVTWRGDELGSLFRGYVILADGGHLETGDSLAVVFEPLTGGHVDHRSWPRVLSTRLEEHASDPVAWATYLTVRVEL